MRVGIRGVGIAGAFGTGVGELRDTLAGIRSRPQPATVNPPATRGSEETLALLCDTTRLEHFIPRKALRRIDHFSRMALLGAHLALEDAGERAWDGRGTGLVVATGYGAARTTFSFLDSFMDGGDALSSPTSFSNSVHNAAAAAISMSLGIEGPNLSVSQFAHPVPSALLTAALWLAEGRVGSVLFGAVDEFCDVLGYCRRRFYGPAQGDGKPPLDMDRHAHSAGEGAAFLLLGPGDTAADHPYGAICGIRAGASGETPPPGDDHAAFFLSAGSHAGFGTRHASLVPSDATVACYAPLFGSLPTGQAFDLAVAAVSLRERRLFPSPVPGGGHPWREVTVVEDLDGRSIRCVTAGPESIAAGAIALEW